jgi:hypothetical protein
MGIYYVFECAVDNCSAEFYLNDIPIVLRSQDGGRLFGGQVNELVVDGVNEIGAVIHPGPQPGLAIRGQEGKRDRFVAKDAKVFAALSTYPQGAVVGGPDRRQLIRLDWEADPDGWPEVFPKVVTTTEDLGPLLGEWAWENAPRLTLDADTRREIEGFLSTLHEALTNGDPEPFIEAGAIRLAEVEKAFDLKPGMKAEHVRKVTLRDAAQPWWGMQPLNSDQFDLRLCAGGRLVECIGHDFQPLLKESPDDDGGVGMYDMLLAKIEDKWQIVR